MNNDLLYADEVYAIQGAVFAIYNEMGNGFLEEVYQQCLEQELASRGIPFEAKRELVIYYKGRPITKKYIPDIMCYGKIIVELKSCKTICEEYISQLDNYLRLTKCKLGLIVNFGSYPKVTIKRWAK